MTRETKSRRRTPSAPGTHQTPIIPRVPSPTRPHGTSPDQPGLRAQRAFHVQVLEAIRSGFDRIDGTMKLGLGIEDPSQKIGELETELATLQMRHDELKAELEVFRSRENKAEAPVEPEPPEEPPEADDDATD